MPPNKTNKKGMSGGLCSPKVPNDSKNDLKSVILQYNTLGCLDDGDKRIIDQVRDVPNIIFFMTSCKILWKNPFNLFSYFFHKITKIKIKSFECPKSIRNYKKKIMLGTSDAWLTRL